MQFELVDVEKRWNISFFVQFSSTSKIDALLKQWFLEPNPAALFVVLFMFCIRTFNAFHFFLNPLLAKRRARRVFDLNDYNSRQLESIPIFSHNMTCFWIGCFDLTSFPFHHLQINYNIILMQIVRNGFQIIIIEIILIYTHLKCQNGWHRAMFWDREQKKWIWQTGKNIQQLLTLIIEQWAKKRRT